MYHSTVFVFCYIVLSYAEEYQNPSKLWNKDSSVIDVTSASIVIQPSRFSNQYYREAKVPYTYRRYAFKPRAIPLAEQPQEENKYYSDAVNKSEILFPGDYMPITKEKGDETDGQFQAKAIPLTRSDEYQGRSLDVDEPIIEKPKSFSDDSASRRSLSYIFGVDSEEDDDYGEYEKEEITNEESEKGGIKKRKIKQQKKLKKYMLPLLLAYKMKYFALVPVLISGLVLLIGATGLAGFFFALFAAVMGLQKGGY